MGENWRTQDSNETAGLSIDTEHGGAVFSAFASQREGAGISALIGPLCLVFVYSVCVTVGFCRVFLFPPTVQKHVLYVG